MEKTIALNIIASFINPYEVFITTNKLQEIKLINHKTLFLTQKFVFQKIYKKKEFFVSDSDAFFLIDGRNASLIQLCSGKRVFSAKSKLLGIAQFTTNFVMRTPTSRKRR